MAKKTIGFVELAWTCPNCETENPGPRKFCTGCGAPQPHDVEFHHLADAILLTEQADIQKAKAGPDIHCPYCRARNPAKAEFCGACGGGLEGAEARASGRIVGAYQEEKGLDKECPYCSTLNTSTAMECAGCGGSLAIQVESAGSEEKSTQSERKGFPKFVGIGCLAVFLVAAGLFFFNLLSKEELTGTVQQVEWSHTVPIQELAPVQAEDWRDQVPAEAEDLNCQEALRETSDQPVTGALEVCGTPYTVDQGSGYGEVVQDCFYEVYDDLCSYTVMDWSVVDAVTVSGNDLEPYWPDISIGMDQQAGEGEFEYVVIFQTSDDSYRYYPDDEVEFSRYIPGSNWLLEVNKLGGVSVIEASQ